MRMTTQSRPFSMLSESNLEDISGLSEFQDLFHRLMVITIRNTECLLHASFRSVGVILAEIRSSFAAGLSREDVFGIIYGSKVRYSLRRFAVFPLYSGLLAATYTF